jgi:hypothetical protein
MESAGRMFDITVVWDPEDDEDGNFRHIVEGHDVSIDEVEEVLSHRLNHGHQSRSTGRPMAFGWTSSDRFLAVPYEVLCDDPFIVKPITAYPVEPPRSRRHER